MSGLSSKSLLIAGSLMLLAGCGGGRYDLFLDFPDQEARDSTAVVEIWAIDPEEATCPELVDGEVSPGAVEVQAKDLLTLPKQETSRLSGVPTGEWLFFAEGRTSSGARILRGCTRARVQLDAVTEVVIQLIWICHPDPVGEIPDNGEDDDCDGLTDECQDDEECADGNPCTDDRCLAGECRQASLPDDTSCSDGLFCTTGDACRNGLCIGASADCDDGDPCTEDDCDEAQDICTHGQLFFPGAEGPPGDPSCGNGEDDDCDGETDLDDVNCNGCTNDSECTDANECTHDVCQNTACTNEPVPDGTGCNDEEECTIEDTCNQGLCEGRIWDDDGDGHLNTGCGGDDCDDNNAGVYPGAEEGPAGAPVCSDLLDNDCDGHTDHNDYACRGQGLCSVDGWCWLFPWPQGNDILDIWWNRSDDVWFALGEAGVMRWNGETFVSLPLELDLEARVIWGSAEDDVWVAGLGNELGHWNGSAWSVVSNPCQTIRDIWGASTDDVWAACTQGWVMHWDGLSWDSTYLQIPQSLYAVWGLSGNDVWVVGYDAAIQHWDGADWTAVDSGLDNIAFNGVHGTATNDIWIVGAYGTLLHWDGVELLPHSTAFGEQLRSVVALAPDDVWAVGENLITLHWNGSAWESMGTSGLDDFYSMAGGSRDIWIGGDYGLLHHWSDSVLRDSYGGRGRTVNGVFARTSADVWVAGEDALLMQWTGNDWISHDPGSAAASLNAVWAAGPDDVWVVGSGIFHWDGESWTRLDSPVAGFWYAVHGCAPDDVWIAGGEGWPFLHAGLLHWDGTALRAMAVEGLPTLLDVACMSSTLAWAVGMEGTFIQWDGFGWFALDAGVSSDLTTVVVLSEADAWMASTQSVRHWDGNEWSFVPASDGANGGWIQEAGVAWFAGDSGIQRCTPQACTKSESGVTSYIDLTAISGVGNEIWAGGQLGVLLKRGP